MKKMIEFSKKQADFIRGPYSHCLDVAEGTPRSGKTFAATQRFALHLLASHDENHLITAYSQEQAYRLVIDGDGFGLLKFFEGNVRIKHDDHGDHLFLTLPTGNKKVYYRGGGKADSQKSITGISLGSVYFCEINLLHPDMVQECFRRTFAARDRWHIADLNPPPPNHPIIKDVFEVQDTYWTHWTLDDNPIITAERKEEIRRTCEKNPYLYKRDFLGERAIPEGVIYSMFDPQRHILPQIPPDAEIIEMFFSGDGGLTDATSIDCFVVARVGEKICLLRVANWYYDGSNMAMSMQARHIAREFIPYCREKTGKRETDIFIDPACKALRKELEILGFYTRGADNNARDVKGGRKGIAVGIEYLQSAIADDRFFLIDDPKYGNEAFLREVGLYVTDDNGNPVDKYNHNMDSARYGNNYYYKRYVCR